MKKPPKWLVKRTQQKSTRQRSGDQEKKLARELEGNTTINSGATFGENDVVTKVFEIEAKTTSKKSFSLSKDLWKKLEDRTPIGKIPLTIVTFEDTDESFVTMRYEDFLSNYYGKS